MSVVTRCLWCFCFPVASLPFSVCLAEEPPSLRCSSNVIRRMFALGCSSLLLSSLRNATYVLPTRVGANYTRTHAAQSRRETFVVGCLVYSKPFYGVLFLRSRTSLGHIRFVEQLPIATVPWRCCLLFLFLVMCFARGSFLPDASWRLFSALFLTTRSSRFFSVAVVVVAVAFLLCRAVTCFSCGKSFSQTFEPRCRVLGLCSHRRDLRPDNHLRVFPARVHEERQVSVEKSWFP